MSTTQPIAFRKTGEAPYSANAVREADGGRFVVLQTKPDLCAEHPVTFQVTGIAPANRAEMLETIRQGLHFGAVEQLELALQASRKEIAAVLSIPVSTLTRRKNEGRLHSDESDRVVRVAHLADAAIAMMHGDQNAALNWLRTPLDILGNETPLMRASTELGARDVEDLIGRLRHGVFS